MQALLEKKKKQEITDRGCNPLNYNLLLHPDIRATMTRDEKESEILSDNDIFLTEYLLNTSTSSKQQSTDSTRLNNIDAITTTTTTVTDMSSKLSLNFSTGMSAICLSDILRHEQLQEARERTQNEKRDGEDVTANLRAARKISASMCWKHGTNRLGKSIFEVVKKEK